jgi:hypothetical protein
MGAPVDTPKCGARDGKVVRRLDEFPQLLEALRDGDLLTARLFCAHLFGVDRWQRSDAGEEPIAVEDSIVDRRVEGG